MSERAEIGGHDEFELEQRLGTLLRAGVLLSALVTLIGGVMYLLSHGHDVANHTAFRGEPAQLRTVGGVMSGALAGDSAAIIQLGVLLLIATPIARVAMSLVGFARERDWTYVWVSLLVLVLLGYGLAHGG